MSLSLLSNAPNVDAVFALGLTLLSLTVSAVPLNGYPLNL